MQVYTHSYNLLFLHLQASSHKRLLSTEYVCVYLVWTVLVCAYGLSLVWIIECTLLVSLKTFILWLLNLAIYKSKYIYSSHSFVRIGPLDWKSSFAYTLLALSLHFLVYSCWTIPKINHYSPSSYVTWKCVRHIARVWWAPTSISCHKQLYVLPFNMMTNLGIGLWSMYSLYKALKKMKPNFFKKLKCQTMSIIL